MCGRFSLFVPPDDLATRFDAEPIEPIEPHYNIPPGAPVAAVPNDRPDEIHRFRWGLVPHWADDPADWSGLINARAETVGEKPAFRDAFAERRCLVLADGFYEWQAGRGTTQPYRIQRADGEPFAFAGLWEPRQSSGGDRETVAIITTAANGVVGPIHDRMPVILSPDETRQWLGGADDTLLDPYPDEQTDAYPISTAVNDPANDSPAVIQPVAVDEQSGLGDFS